MTVDIVNQWVTETMKVINREFVFQQGRITRLRQGVISRQSHDKSYIKSAERIENQLRKKP